MTFDTTVTHSRVKGVRATLRLYSQTLPCFKQMAHVGLSFEHCSEVLGLHT